ncbi:uncharacterized protein CIMG_03915 [Coccidioides immitis RS]|uniref:Uncharacterized protein n=1 Tax=Coccidioides immitis (strain RS) TaxID=246410 RepID=J3KCD7_COCIM|nr:uncharacterized protein CIMG_03915 [Coccidioides immitis RS]EAS32891.3 hypothetical protein CIMG_03915 [Coccidioides immitis RS]
MAVAPCTVASPEVACRFPSVKVTENSKLFLAAIGLRLKLPAEPYPLEIRRGRESTAPRRISEVLAYSVVSPLHLDTVTAVGQLESTRVPAPLRVPH